MHESLASAMEAWVNRHPTPDSPSFSIAQSGQFTPRQLLREVRDRSDVGLHLEEMVETAVAGGAVTLEQVLHMFQGSNTDMIETENPAPAYKYR
jgi:hypothetical protein